MNEESSIVTKSETDSTTNMSCFMCVRFGKGENLSVGKSNESMMLKSSSHNSDTSEGKLCLLMQLNISDAVPEIDVSLLELFFYFILIYLF